MYLQSHPYLSIWFRFFVFSSYIFLSFPQIQVPLYVATKMASIKRSSFFVPSTDGYARAALRWIGYEPRCTPYWPHTLLWALAYSIPEWIVDAWRLQFCLGIRKRGQLKDSRKKDQNFFVPSLCRDVDHDCQLRFKPFKIISLDGELLMKLECSVFLAWLALATSLELRSRLFLLLLCLI